MHETCYREATSRERQLLTSLVRTKRARVKQPRHLTRAFSSQNITHLGFSRGVINSGGFVAVLPLLG